MAGYYRMRAFTWVLNTFAPQTRAARMAEFVKLLQPKPGQRVIDLGGTSELWGMVDVPLNVTVMNLPGTDMKAYPDAIHSFTFTEGDATSTGLPDDSFDIVFSNSVIEHVGDAAKQAAFAREVRRLAPAYYVQTPSILFPLEAHTGIPFWWLFPGFAKRAMYRRWARILPAWGQMVEGTTVIRSAAFRRFFPDATIGVERIAGIPKSYYGYRRTRGAPVTRSG